MKTLLNGGNNLTTIGTLMIVGDDNYPDRICDCCERRMDGMPHYHWGEKDFDLCFECLEKFYKDTFNQEITEENGSEVYKKIPIPKEIRWKIWRRDNFTCQYCGVREDLSIDHIIPESKGGQLIENNLVTACKSCNSKKSMRTPEESGMKLKNDRVE